MPNSTALYTEYNHFAVKAKKALSVGRVTAACVIATIGCYRQCCLIFIHILLLCDRTGEIVSTECLSRDLPKLVYLAKKSNKSIIFIAVENNQNWRPNMVLSSK